jgi:hypothetical protein
MPNRTSIASRLRVITPQSTAMPEHPLYQDENRQWDKVDEGVERLQGRVQRLLARSK